MQSLPHGGGLLDRDEPRLAYSSDGGRVLAADVEWVREFFPLGNAVSTMYLTNEHAALTGGAECRDPDDTTQPSLPACVNASPAGGDWWEDVVIVPTVTDPNTIPPTIGVQFFQKVAATSTAVWQSSDGSTDNRNVHDVDVANTTLPAVPGFNACIGKRIDFFDSNVPDELRAVNLGPQDIEATVRVELISINPADRTDNSTFTVQHQKTWTFKGKRYTFTKETEDAVAAAVVAESCKQEPG